MKYIIKLYSKFFSLFIILELIIRKVFDSRKFFYFNYYGWGDNFVFYLYNYIAIKYKKSNVAISYIYERRQILDFLFEKKKKINFLFSIPKFFPSQSVDIELSKFKLFKPNIILKKDVFREDYFLYNKDSVKNLLIYKLKKNSNNNLSFLDNKKYICFYMRHHNVEVNSFYPSIRQTSDIHKSNKIIDFVLKKNLNVCIVGNKNEKIIRHVELSYRDEIKKNKIFFLKNLCPDYKFSDQLYIFYKSLCYVGSHAGPLVPYYYLKKKAISFDVFYRSEWEKINFSNFIFLYKKIKIDNSIYILDDYYCKNIKKYNYDLIEVSADEIIDNLNKLLKDLYY